MRISRRGDVWLLLIALTLAPAACCEMVPILNCNNCLIETRAVVRAAGWLIAIVGFTTTGLLAMMSEAWNDERPQGLLWTAAVLCFFLSIPAGSWILGEKARAIRQTPRWGRNGNIQEFLVLPGQRLVIFHTEVSTWAGLTADGRRDSSFGAAFKTADDELYGRGQWAADAMGHIFSRTSKRVYRFDSHGHPEAAFGGTSGLSGFDSPGYRKLIPDERGGLFLTEPLEHLDSAGALDRGFAPPPPLSKSARTANEDAPQPVQGDLVSERLHAALPAPSGDLLAVITRSRNYVATSSLLLVGKDSQSKSELKLGARYQAGVLSSDGRQAFLAVCAKIGEPVELLTVPLVDPLRIAAKVLLPRPCDNEGLFQLVVASSDRLLLVTQRRVEKLALDGSRDPTFHPRDFAPSGLRGLEGAAKMQGQRILLLDGTHLVRLNADGTIDDSFRVADLAVWPED